MISVALSDSFFLLSLMLLPNLSPAAKSAFLVAVLRTFLIERDREAIIPHIEGIRETPTRLILLLTSPLAKTEITHFLPQITQLFQNLGYMQKVSTRLIQ
jgi:hypothetical protein